VPVAGTSRQQGPHLDTFQCARLCKQPHTSPTTPLDAYAIRLIRDEYDTPPAEGAGVFAASGAIAGSGAMSGACIGSAEDCMAPIGPIGGIATIAGAWLSLGGIIMGVGASTGGGIIMGAWPSTGGIIIITGAGASIMGACPSIGGIMGAVSGRTSDWRSLQPESKSSGRGPMDGMIMGAGASISDIMGAWLSMCGLIMGAGAGASIGDIIMGSGLPTEGIIMGSGLPIMSAGAGASIDGIIIGPGAGASMGAASGAKADCCSLRP